MEGGGGRLRVRNRLRGSTVEGDGLFEIALIGIIPLVVVIVFHLLILLLLPVRWAAIRGRFREKLQVRLAEELDRAYLPIPGDIATALQDERQRVDALLGATKQVADFLAERQQAARVAELYGA